MSHWTSVKTNITNKEMLKKALNRMGVSFTEGEFTITQYGQSSAAQLKVDEGVGFAQQQDGTWAMVGDPYHSKCNVMSRYYGKNDKLQTDLTTNYAIEKAKHDLELQNFYCSENEHGEVGSDGMITMIFERF